MEPIEIKTLRDLVKFVEADDPRFMDVPLGFIVDGGKHKVSANLPSITGGRIGWGFPRDLRDGDGQQYLNVELTLHDDYRISKKGGVNNGKA